MRCHTEHPPFGEPTKGHQPSLPCFSSLSPAPPTSSAGDLAFNIALGATLVAIPLSIGAVARSAFVKYKFTDRRVSVKTDAPWESECFITTCVTRQAVLCERQGGEHVCGQQRKQKYARQKAASSVLLPAAGSLWLGCYAAGAQWCWVQDSCDCHFSMHLGL